MPRNAQLGAYSAGYNAAAPYQLQPVSLTPATNITLNDGVAYKAVPTINATTLWIGLSTAIEFSHFVFVSPVINLDAGTYRVLCLADNGTATYADGGRVPVHTAQGADNTWPDMKPVEREVVIGNTGAHRLVVHCINDRGGLAFILVMRNATTNAIVLDTNTAGWRYGAPIAGPVVLQVEKPFGVANLPTFTDAKWIWPTPNGSRYTPMPLSSNTNKRFQMWRRFVATATDLAITMASKATTAEVRLSRDITSPVLFAYAYNIDDMGVNANRAAFNLPALQTGSEYTIALRFIFNITADTPSGLALECREATGTNALVFASDEAWSWELVD